LLQNQAMLFRIYLERILQDLIRPYKIASSFSASAANVLHSIGLWLELSCKLFSSKFYFQLATVASTTFF